MISLDILDEFNGSDNVNEVSLPFNVTRGIFCGDDRNNDLVATVHFKFSGMRNRSMELKI